MGFCFFKEREMVWLLKSTTWSQEVTVGRGFGNIFKCLKSDEYPLLMVLLISSYKVLKILPQRSGILYLFNTL